MSTYDWSPERYGISAPRPGANVIEPLFELVPAETVNPGDPVPEPAPLWTPGLVPLDINEEQPAGTQLYRAVMRREITSLDAEKTPMETIAMSHSPWNDFGEGQQLMRAIMDNTGSRVALFARLDPDLDSKSAKEAVLAEYPSEYRSRIDIVPIGDRAPSGPGASVGLFLRDGAVVLPDGSIGVPPAGLRPGNSTYIVEGRGPADLRHAWEAGDVLGAVAGLPVVQGVPGKGGDMRISGGRVYTGLETVGMIRQDMLNTESLMRLAPADQQQLIAVGRTLDSMQHLGYGPDQVTIVADGQETYGDVLNRADPHTLNLISPEAIARMREMEHLPFPQQLLGPYQQTYHVDLVVLPLGENASGEQVLFVDADRLDEHPSLREILESDGAKVVPLPATRINDPAPGTTWERISRLNAVTGYDNGKLTVLLPAESQDPQNPTEDDILARETILKHFPDANVVLVGGAALTRGSKLDEIDKSWGIHCRTIVMPFTLETRPWHDRYRAELLAGTQLAGHAGQLFDMLGYRGVGDVLFAGSKVASAALDPSLGNIFSAGIGLAARFGGEDVRKAAGYASTTKSVIDAFQNPGPGTIAAVAEKLMGHAGVDPKISGLAGLGGGAYAVMAGGGPLAAVGLTMAFADYMNRIAGQPSIVRLSTQIDGQEVPVEYGISAQEYRYFLDAEGHEPHSFNGGVFSMDGRHYLGGSFGYDPLNPLTNNGEGGLAGAILGLPGGFIQRRGDGAMMDSLEIDVALYEQLLGLNGGGANFQASLGDPLFDLVAPRMGLVEQVRYTTDADVGMMLGETDATMLFLHPDLGPYRSSRDHVGALFSNPLMAGYHHFRDAEQAQLFDSFGLMSTMMVAGDAELARAFGGFDAQRILDHTTLNIEAMMGGPIFDVYGYLAANPDVQQAAGANMMQAMEHYLNFGVHEGRGFATDEDARLRAMARVTGLGLFDEAAYLALNPDIAAAVARGETTARAHYETFGFEESRKPFFDEQSYLAANPDVAAHVAAGGGSAIDHYVQFGQHEGRELAPQAPIFDEAAYLAANPDVAAAVANGTMESAYGHFERHGQAEGRGFFDEQTYLDQNPDVAEAVANGGGSGIEHYQAFGQHEGRQAAIAPGVVPAPAPVPAQAFDEAAYLAANPDVAEAVANGGGSAQEHYSTYGAAEGRALA